MALHKISESLTHPAIEEGTRVVLLICSNDGIWKAKHISKMYDDPEDFYNRQFRYARSRNKLGAVQWVFVEQHFAIVNLIAEDGQRDLLNPSPLDTKALERCFNRVAEGCHGLLDSTETKVPSLTLHMERNKDERVEDLLADAFWDIDVYVYG